MNARRTRLRSYGVLLMLAFSTAPVAAAILWAENFDDGDISDWTIANAYEPGDNPIIIEPSTEQSASPAYAVYNSFLVLL